MQYPGNAAPGTAPDSARRVWFVAALPPPVNGQANCNAAMESLLSGSARLVALPLGRSPLGKIARTIANSWTLLRRARRGEVAYLSIPGQQGTWLLLPSIIAARLRGLPMWFHHHSFRPINRGPLAAMRTLIAAAGTRQHHILLSEGMRDRFAALYLRRNTERAYAMSNTFLVAPGTHAGAVPRPNRPFTLGHVSVLTREKGVVYLIELFENLRRHIPDIRLVIAGPSRDAGLLDMILTAQARHPGALEYRGEIAGAQKDRFYRDIDLFVLPTTLVDEAEPLVMIEAYSRGIDVVATAIGCIPDRIRDPRFILSLDRGEDIQRIAAISRLGTTDWPRQRRDCQTHAAQMSAKGNKQGSTIIAQIIGGAKMAQAR